MRFSRTVGTLAVIASLVVALPASGQPPAQTVPGNPPVRELIVGDWYTIDVQVGPVQERLEGDFAKDNDRWIVLRHISESRNDVVVPLSSKVPFVKIKKAVSAQQTEYLWIPRPSARIISHTAAAKRVPIEDVLPEAPAAGTSCRVMEVRDQKSATSSGRLVELTNEKVALESQRRAYVKRSIPYLGELPLVGRTFFTSTKSYDQIVRDESRLNDVLCIRYFGDREAETPTVTPAEKR
ncbi:MAG TPA: hypothetical protein VGN12_21050 [Pirellulales bacterium]|jgi:hypothetical protein